MTIVVYTALLGPGWELHDPQVIETGVSYVAFTDREEHRSDCWEVRRIATEGDPRVQSRLLKTRADILLPNVDISMWMDSRFTLEVKPSRIVNEWLEMWDMVAFRHPDRDRIEDEAIAIAQLGKDRREVLDAQIAHYRADGFTHQRAITSTGLCFRRHSRTVKLFNELWWDEVRTRSRRDQMSVDYCAWKAGLRIGYLPGHYRANPYATWIKS